MMLDIKVEGETHPKTFKLVTDDAQGELARLAEILDLAEVASDDPLRGWLAEHSSEQFAEGVVIPASEVGEFADLLVEADWWEAMAKIEAQREDALSQIEDAL